MKNQMEKTIDKRNHFPKIHKSVSVTAATLMIFLLVMIAIRMQPPAPKGPDAAPDLFSAGRAVSELRDLFSGEGPHAVGSAAQARIRQRLIEKLGNLGYAVETQESFICAAGACTPVKNLLTRLPGRETGPAVLLAAHYDSVAAGPGVADDGAGIAAVLEIARIVKSQAPFRNPLIFLLTDAEELGALGAGAFAAEHPWTREVGVVINLEARGTGGISFMFETSGPNLELISAYAQAVSRPAASSLFFEIYRHLPNTTDLAVFKREKIAGFNLAFADQSIFYHTPLDDFDHLNPGSLQHQGDQALALLRRLAESDLTHSSRQNAVYTDLLGFGVLMWPESWSLPLVLLIGLLFSAAAVHFFRKRGLKIRFFIWGLGIWLTGIMLPVLLGLAFQWAIAKLSGQSAPWHAYPLPMRMVLWSNVIFCGLLFITWFSKRVPFRERGLAVWPIWIGLALAGAFLLPGICIFFLVPAAGATLALIVVRFLPARFFDFGLQMAFLTAALASGLLWLPLALIMETALSFDMTPAITWPLALVMTAFIPLFTPSGKSLRFSKYLLLVSAVVMLGAAVIATVLPSYSETRPHHLNFIYFKDCDNGKTYWAARSLQKNIPAAVRQAGKFGDTPLRIFPWPGSPAYTAAAESLAEPGPEIRKESEKVIGEKRILHARLQSLRGALGMLIVFPPEVPLEKVVIEGKPIPLASITDPRNGFKIIDCRGLPGRGFRIELHLARSGSSEIILVDHSSGLPPGGEHLLKARLSLAVPVNDGDVTLFMRRFML